MNRKIIAFITALSAILLAVGCNGVSSDSQRQEADGSSVSDSQSSNSAPDDETQPDPLAPKPTDSAENTTTAPKESETEASEAPIESTSEVAVDENGAVIVEPDAELSDADLINAAQRLYESACTVNWNFHVGCPYSLSYEDYVENELQWQYYLVTSDGINSIADVEADYYKVFSDSYENDLSELYIEKDGRVYALDGARGSNIYYENSKITSIKERSENEIIFEVESYYNSDDYGVEGDVTKKSEFSAVISKDGTWKAGAFTLPY